MLPIPFFFLLVFGVSILAPAPAILIHLVKTVSLSAPASHILSIPALPTAFRPPAEQTLYLPSPDPQPTLDVASLCPSFVDVAPNNTTPILQAHETSGYTAHVTVLPVVVLAVFNCLVRHFLYFRPLILLLMKV